MGTHSDRYFLEKKQHTQKFSGTKNSTYNIGSIRQEESFDTVCLSHIVLFLIDTSF